MSQGSLSTILNNNPSIRLLQDIASIIGVSLSELLSDDESAADAIAVEVKAPCPKCHNEITLEVHITE